MVADSGSPQFSVPPVMLSRPGIAVESGALAEAWLTFVIQLTLQMSAELSDLCQMLQSHTVTSKPHTFLGDDESDSQWSAVVEGDLTSLTMSFTVMVELLCFLQYAYKERGDGT